MQLVREIRECLTQVKNLKGFISISWVNNFHYLSEG